MELWIRSQDKSNLKIVNDIYVEHITKDYDTWVGNIHSRSYVITSDNGNLGFYATQERALEVLDEIENRMLKGSFARMENGLGELQNIIPNPIFIYKMPEE